MAVLISILLLIPVLVELYLLFRLLKNPHDSLGKYVHSWRYRTMLKIRGWYIEGSLKDPPYSHQFMFNRIVSYLNDNEEMRKKPVIDRQEICDMLQNEAFVRFYFRPEARFRGEDFDQMYNDYKTGQYLFFDLINNLKIILPSIIASNHGALCDYAKLTAAGWFDLQTGLPVESKQKQEIGRALDLIVRRNGIHVSAKKIFAPFLGVDEDTLKEWCRTNRNNEQITEDIDAEIKAILNS